MEEREEKNLFADGERVMVGMQNVIKILEADKAELVAAIDEAMLDLEIIAENSEGEASHKADRLYEKFQSLLKKARGEQS